MGNTGRNGEKSGYLVILLLFVGLTAFSNSMKELAQIHQLTWDASRLVSQWSDTSAPAVIPSTVVKLESCENRLPAPVVVVQPLTESSAVSPTQTVLSAAAPVKVASRPVETKPLECEIAKLKKLRNFNIDPVQFEVRLSADHDEDADAPVAEVSAAMFKAKNRRHGAIKINTRDREMLLKALNRSINLRISS